MYGDLEGQGSLDCVYEIFKISELCHFSRDKNTSFELPTDKGYIMYTV